MTTGGTIANAVATAPCPTVPPFSLRSRRRIYVANMRSAPARQRNACHCSRPRAARIASRFIGVRERRGLRPQFLAIAILLEGFGIGERLDVFHVATMHDVAHRQLDDLAALGARNVGDLDDFRRDMT